jgi:hypothetical protein
MKARHKRQRRQARLGRRAFWADLSASLFDVNREPPPVVSIEDALRQAFAEVRSAPRPWGPLILTPAEYEVFLRAGLVDGAPPPREHRRGGSPTGGGREWRKRLARRAARFCELRTLLEMTDRQRRMLDEMWRHFTEKVGGQVHTIYANLIATDPGFNLQAVL